MKKTLRVIIWLAVAPIVATLVFLSLNAIFYQEPAERFVETGNVAQLLADVEQLEILLANNPDNDKKQLQLAHCYQAMGRYPEAINAFGKAWASVEKSPEELTYFAEVLAKNKDNDFSGKSTALLEQALQQDSNHIDALILYGTALLSQKQREKAASQWQKAYDLMKVDDPRRLELGKMLKQLEK